ncbi:MAG TPA: asparagine synthase (glutamine-hydrolyzing) [Gemmatimonadales bacterium]|jgi:asparagine synthase (glutamine-hydrolysing)|nr:asparagine synthase (glutamine-hydrolyzing) [Gemmatimonadales bacterium]
MCGFAGVARREPNGVVPAVLQRMATAIRHRGPDGLGAMTDAQVGLAHARLSIIDLEGGAQPMGNSEGTLAVVYNGEIFNFPDLKDELAARGYTFQTRSDTEVLLHAYAEWGEAMLDRLNGQFAFVIYDRREKSLFLVRDRFGILPLYYAERGGDLYFGSEVKALFASGEVPRALDPAGLDEVFTFWAARPPRTPFQGVSALEPGCCARWQSGRLTFRRWYTLAFAAGAEAPGALQQLVDLMDSSVRRRLLADVPVGGYLSGGLDSSAVCALAARDSSAELRTFSVAFADPQFDESAHQQAVAEAVRSRHAVQHIGPADIARVFPEVIRHTETPLVRTAPAPLYLLSQLARQRGIKVVLSGEGADELFYGYDLFKEAVVREFCLRQPDSPTRPRLFDRLYPYLARGGARAGDFWRRFFLNAGSTSDPLFSHLPRFGLTSWIKEFYSAEFRAAVNGFDGLGELRDALPPAFSGWSTLQRAAYLEMVTLLSPYLLSSQGDRMAMAHGVEARVPYLDHRVFEFAAALPDRSKLRGLREKEILRRWAANVLPASAAQRVKQPYRAPDVPAFFEGEPPPYVAELLDESALKRGGIFDPAAARGLVRRCRTGQATGVREGQALVAILSTQLWQREFFETPVESGALRYESGRFVLAN